MQPQSHTFLQGEEKNVEQGMEHRGTDCGRTGIVYHIRAGARKFISRLHIFSNLIKAVG
jgi:hypothetical protein